MMALLVPLIALLLAAPAVAQDALRGKRLYHDLPRLSAAPLACVDCHGAWPGALHGIGRAAGSAAAIEYAIGAIPQMAPLREKLRPRDLEDLAAYLLAPEVPSPILRLETAGEAAVPGNPERLSFRASRERGEPTGTVTLRNAGARPIRFEGAAAIAGPQAVEFRMLVDTCSPVGTLAPGGECRFEVAFAPGGAGLRRAILAIRHDWIRGEAAIALLGTRESPRR